MATVTSFPNFIGSYLAVATGGTAGDHTLVSAITPAIGDKIQSALQIDFGTNGQISAVANLTAEFTTPLTAASTATNTTTDTTGALLLFQITDISAGV